MAIKHHKSVAVVSMSGRDTAMWFSFTGLYHALSDKGVKCSFYFPYSKIEEADSYNDNVFFYSLRKPFKTFISVLNLARLVNKKHDQVVIFSQGVFSAILVSLLRLKIDVISWGHELENHISRAGFMRGLNYYLSDRVMSLRTKSVIVSSTELFNVAKKIYPRKNIIYAPLPLSGDFYLLLKHKNGNKFLPLVSGNNPSRVNALRVLFFGGVTAYKGLANLDQVVQLLPDDKISIKIIGRGDLPHLAPELYNRSVTDRNVSWDNTFISASDLASELMHTDYMYVMYDSVTATSQIDIANAFGVPVIVSDLPFFRSRVVNGVNGFIVEQGKLLDFFVKHANSRPPSRDKVIAHFREAGVNESCIKQLVAQGVFDEFNS